MIKINLIAQPKKFKIPVVLGLDIRMFNFKMLFVVGLISFTPEVLQKFYFEIELAKINTKISFYKKELSKYNKILKKNRLLKKKIEAFTIQADKLKERERQVLEVIKQRTNPFKVLVKLAESLPIKVWTSRIKLDRDAITVNGLATSYKSIGEFIDTLNDSIYFSKTIRLKKTESITKKVNRDEFRVEKFEIVGKILRFD